MLGGRIDESTLVELVTEPALNKPGSCIVTESTKVALDLTILPMVIVGTSGYEAAKLREFRLG